MKNPYILKLKNGESYPCGDPFILRFNGKYYLYPSSTNKDDGIRCFVSNDLSSFVEYGYVARDERLINAYAPELICHNGIFYLCTSPNGNGHYFLKSNSPLGPFEFISENANSMIDGSFVHDEKYQIKFVRADHNGIAMLDFDEKHILSNRRNILPQISRGWTEGPTVFYRYPYYYATYCGNFLLSTAYRIKYGTSKTIDFDYRPSDEPLIISTEKDFSALGHNSIMIGPDLHTYYAAYHIFDEHRPFRYLGIDRLYFNGRKLVCNVNDFIDQSFDQCTCSCDLSQDKTKVIYQDDCILLNEKTTDSFIAEFNFKGNVEIVFSYDKGQYGYIYLSNEKKIFSYKESSIKLSISPKFDFDKFHCLRLENKDYLYMYIDNVFITKLEKVGSGYIGYKNKDNELFYTAFTNLIKKDESIIVPGTIFPKEDAINNFLDKDEVFYNYLSENDIVSFNINSKDKDDYYIYMFASIEEDIKLLISSEDSKREITIVKKKSEYIFNNYCLGKVRFNEKDKISLKVLSGNIKWKYILVRSLNKIKNSIERVNKDDSRYAFYLPSKILSLKFTIHQFKDNSLFGLIINASNFSNHSSNHHPQYMGYLVGFRNDLLVVEHCQYETERIYDKPIRIELNHEYQLQVKIDEHQLQVFIDNQLMIITDLIYQDVIGMSGILYDSNVSLKDFKQEDFYE